MALVGFSCEPWRLRPFLLKTQLLTKVSRKVTDYMFSYDIGDTVMILDHSHDAYGEDCKIRGRYQSNGDEMYYIESVKPPIRFFDIDGSSLVFRPPVVKTFRFKKGQEVIITNRDRDSYNKKGVVVGDVELPPTRLPVGGQVGRGVLGHGH